jgi:hypothetical protein
VSVIGLLVVDAAHKSKELNYYYYYYYYYYYRHHHYHKELNSIELLSYLYNFLNGHLAVAAAL